HAICSSYYRYLLRLHLHSFPTRRSSDLFVLEPDRHLDVADQEVARLPVHGPAPFYIRIRQVKDGLIDSPISSGLGSSVCRYKTRSEEHTSELQSRGQLVCRLLLEKKKVPARGRLAAETAARGRRAARRSVSGARESRCACLYLFNPVHRLFIHALVLARSGVHRPL